MINITMIYDYYYRTATIVSGFRVTGLLFQIKEKLCGLLVQTSTIWMPFLMTTNIVEALK